jgi:hypothetical protein
MFEQYQDKSGEKRDQWFYPTIIFAAVTIIVLTIFALNYSDFIFVSSLFSKGRNLEGEVSVVTKEQGNIRLPALKVCAIQEGKILEWIRAKNQKSEEESKKAKLKLDYARYGARVAERDYNAAQNSEERARAETDRKNKSSQISKAESDYRYWFSPAFYFSGLKECDLETRTDSNGRFSLTLKEGKYGLAVRAEPETTNLKEEYFWLLWVTPENAGKQITLNNDNLIQANPAERVIEIKEF